MKYDRPVRELLADCVSVLPQPFEKADVISWFRSNYPAVAESTINTHIAGLTAGNRPHEHLARFPPLMERVGHGLYRRVGSVAVGVPLSRPATRQYPSRTERSSHVHQSSSEQIVLIGCVKSKLAVPAPAKDLYTSALFRRRLAYAEASGDRWFIVSARLGLVVPDEFIAPYDLYLPDKSVRYRAAWGVFVAAQLAEQVGSLGNVRVEIHAGDAYVGALLAPLEALGALVTDPVRATSMGATLAWYDTNHLAIADTPVERTSQTDHVNGDDDLDLIVELLSSFVSSMSVTDLLAQPPASLATPGMYSWWVDEEGARDLTTGLGHPIRAGLIYAGQAGATRWPSGTRSTNTLWGRLASMHLGGRARFSTFRLTLASILQPDASGGIDEAALTQWMTAHLRVVTLPMLNGDTIDQIETKVLAQLDPPLNLAKRPTTPLRQALSARRNQVGVR